MRISLLDSVGPRPLASTSRWSTVAAALAIAVFFVSYNTRAVDVHFSSDEMMNIYWYWEPGAWKVTWANILFWRAIIRPMGGVYYLPLFHLFGLNPWPYTVVRLALLLLDFLLLVRLAKRLTGSLAAATLAVMVLAYHPQLVSLTHNGSFIYDILCAGFYFGALLYYLHCRDSGRCLTLRQGAVFLVLYICALDSKEMAVSLPLVICSYEVLEASRGATAIATRFLMHIRPLAAAVLVTYVFLALKTYGPVGLAQIEVYRPVITWARFGESSQQLVNAIFCTGRFSTRSVLAVWAVMLYVGLRKRNRGLLLLLVWVVATPLPLNFIPPHGPGCLYIPLAGWSMLVAMACEGIAGQLAREPLFAWLPERAAVVCILAAALCYYTSVATFRHNEQARAYFRNGEKTWNVIEQFRALPFRPPHGSRIAFLNDPFPEDWDTLFIAKLWWNDRTLQVYLQNQQHLTATELARMDHIFDFENGRLTRLKP